jgi:hypothetical protein
LDAIKAEKQQWAISFELSCPLKTELKSGNLNSVLDLYVFGLRRVKLRRDREN